ncbi:MAG: hypothetical protein E7662_00505 [Ruminococcaceae bacterium]|nr:hypothetical protein [Oscillospiraceae bacterium]
MITYQKYVYICKETDIYEKYQWTVQHLHSHDYTYRSIEFSGPNMKEEVLSGNVDGIPPIPYGCRRIVIKNIHWHDNAYTALPYIDSQAGEEPDSICISEELTSFLISVDHGKSDVDTILQTMIDREKNSCILSRTLPYLSDQERSIPVSFSGYTLDFPDRELLQLSCSDQSAPRLRSAFKRALKNGKANEFFNIFMHSDYIELRRKNELNHIFKLVIDYAKDSSSWYMGKRIPSSARCTGFYSGINFHKLVCDWVAQINNDAELELFCEYCLERGMKLAALLDQNAGTITEMKTPDWFGE